LLFQCLLMVTFLQAQQNYIEVSSEDTILVKADLFIYTINVSVDVDDLQSDTSRAASFIPFTMKIDMRKQEVQLHFDSLKLQLQQMGYQCLSTSLADAFAVQTHWDGSFSASFIINSFDSLIQAFQFIKRQKGVSSFVTVASAKDEAAHRKILYKKLIDEATTKAKYIAFYSHQTILGITSVTENSVEEKKASGGWTSYGPLSASGDAKIHSTQSSQKFGIILSTDPRLINLYPIKGSFTVRFAAK
jgi:hypothetical protein